jgi:hypothetical protein
MNRNNFIYFIGWMCEMYKDVWMCKWWLRQSKWVLKLFAYFENKELRCGVMW